MRYKTDKKVLLVLIVAYMGRRGWKEAFKVREWEERSLQGNAFVT